jgi:S-adenosylmethionine hydrolase
MKFITLATDYDLKDFYLGKVKLKLLKTFPKSHILDIHHHLNIYNPSEQYNLKDTAFSINAMLTELDNDCLNLIFVNVHYTQDFHFVVAKSKKHGIFIAPNNGIFGLIETEFESFSKIEVKESTFAELDLIDKIKDLKFDVFPKMNDAYFSNTIRASINESEMRGEIIYIDGYGNCMVNIKKSDFEAFVGNSNYEIDIRRNKILSLSKTYSDVREGGFAVFFNSIGLMEISFIQDRANSLLGLKKGIKIIVKKS